MNNEKRYLVYQEVHDQYGIGRRLVTTLVSSRQLHRVKVGTAWRYDRNDLENIFSGGRIRRHLTPSRNTAF